MKKKTKKSEAQKAAEKKAKEEIKKKKEDLVASGKYTYKGWGVLGPQVLVDTVTGQPAKIDGGDGGPGQQGRNPAEQIREQAQKEHDEAYGGKGTAQAQPLKPTEAQRGSAEGAYAGAFDDFLVQFKDAIERGYPRQENGIAPSLWTVLRLEEFTSCIVTDSERFFTPLEHANLKYREDMVAVRKELAEKLESKEACKLNSQEMDVLIVTMLRHANPQVKEFFFDYLLCVATSAGRVEDAGEFIGTVISALTNYSTISTNLNDKAKVLGATLPGLMAPETAAEYFKNKSYGIIERTANEFAATLPEDMDDFTTNMYVTSFKQTLLSSKAVIKEPEKFAEKMYKEYRTDITPVINDAEALMDSVNRFEGERTKKESIDEKFAELKEKIGQLDDSENAKKEIDKTIKALEKIYNEKNKFYETYSEKVEKLVTKAIDSDKEMPNADSAIKILTLSIVKKNSEIEDLREKIKKVRTQDDPIIKSAKEIVKKMGTTKTMDGITESQYVIATIVYEGGLKGRDKMEDSQKVDIKEPKFKKFRAWYERIGIIKLTSEDETSREQLKKDIAEGWETYKSKMPVFSRKMEKDENVSVLTLYALLGAKNILEGKGEVKISEDTKNKCKTFVETARGKISSKLDKDDAKLDKNGIYMELAEKHTKEEILNAINVSLFADFERYYNSGSRKERKEVERTFKEKGIRFERDYNAFEKMVGSSLKLVDNYLTTPWISWERVDEIDNGALRVLAKVGSIGVLAPQVVLSGAVAVGIKLPKWLLWDAKWGKTELGVMKRIYGHFKNSWEEVQGKDKEGKLKLLTRRIWFGTRLAVVSTTVAIAALAYVPYVKNNDFIRAWRQQIHVNPFHWGGWELAYPNFRAGPFAENGKGWSILNEQHRNKEREEVTEMTSRSMVNDLFKGNLEKGEHERFMLQFCYSDVTRKNIDSRMTEPELKAQLKWLREHPEVEKFLLERRYLKKIGKITAGLDKVKYKKIDDALKKAGWRVAAVRELKGGTTGYTLERLGLLAGEEGKVKDGLKLNKNKTKKLVAELMQAEAKGKELDGNYKIDSAYLYKNLRVWEKKSYFVPKMIEAYMNTYGVKDPKTAELLIASPEMAKWLSPMVAKGQAPVYIKKGRVERIVEMLKYKIETTTGKVGLVPLLPQDEMVKKQILADVMVWAGKEGVLGDCMAEYAKNIAVERLKKELGVYCPISPDVVDYVLGKVTTTKLPDGRLEITAEDTEIKKLLVGYHGATATKAIVPEQVDDFVRAVKEHVATGGKVSDFEPVNGVMLEWAEQYGYLRPLLTRIITASGDVYVAAEAVENGGVTEKITKGSEGALAMAGGMLEDLKTEKSYKDLFAKEGAARITAAINAYLLQEIAGVYNGETNTGLDLGISIENDEVMVVDAGKFKNAVMAGLNVIKKSGIDALVKIQQPAQGAVPASKPGEPITESTMATPTMEERIALKLEGLDYSNNVKTYEGTKDYFFAEFESGKEYQIYMWPRDATEKIRAEDGYEEVKKGPELIEKDGKPVYRYVAVYDPGTLSKAKEVTAYVHPDGKITREE